MTDQDHLTPQKYLDITASSQFIAMGWKQDALCLKMVAEGRAESIEWFPEARGHTSKHVPERVKAICGDCPVRLECLCLAIYAGEKNGIWGGRPAKQVQKIRRALMRILR